MQWMLWNLKNQVLIVIPKGATYCLNSSGEVVSNRLIYTGNYIKVQPHKKYDTRKLWKEK